ncbi:hypothetical protein F7725_013162 [Dissostichus mawsoni]|uniref:Uncharacterized protein n=1 Tax=Dissostichus mawsoni TaxID=36200 RepID=A0A7J5YPS8_DISMA|nr:hypothetical protein F7725_013162 [Dissostichus mawsoni]
MTEGVPLPCAQPPFLTSLTETHKTSVSAELLTRFPTARSPAHTHACPQTQSNTCLDTRSAFSRCAWECNHLYTKTLHSSIKKSHSHPSGLKQAPVSDASSCVRLPTGSTREKKEKKESSDSQPRPRPRPETKKQQM